MRTLQRGHWILLGAGLLLGALFAPSYLVWRATPAPLRTCAVSLASAIAKARLSVGGGHVLTAASSIYRGRPVYAFDILVRAGQVETVLLDAASGRVIDAAAQPRPTVVTIGQARAVAIRQVAGGHVLAVQSANLGSRSAYAVTVAAPDGGHWRVFVSRTTGALMAISEVSKPPHLVATGKPVQVAPAAAISSARAGLLALRSVRGAQVLSIQRTEPTDRGQWFYRVRVLLQTSAKVLVEVSPSGRVMWVRANSDS